MTSTSSNGLIDMEYPLIALITDFGEEDFFVGSLKGVIATINPDARIEDICHLVPSCDILAGGFILFASYRYYPSRTIFLVVVDPGVGSERRILLAETDEYVFIAPDNGVLSLALDDLKARRIIEISNTRYFLSGSGATFDGRDKMAPVAAWASKGEALTSFGREVSDYDRIPISQARMKGGAIVGRILYADKFGNLITNIPAGKTLRFEERGKGRRLICLVKGKEISRFEKSYAFVERGELLFLPGSLDLIEIAAREGSAEKKLAAGPGDEVSIALL
jgi:S-adenosylmethionine hydrolase